jgi:hypothetical protein
MSQKKSQRTAPAEPREKLLDSELIKLLAVVTVSHILLWAVVSLLMGSGFAPLVAILWGLSLFVVTKWDRTRASGVHFSFRQLLSFPRLNYLNVLGIILATLVANQFAAFLIFSYLRKARSELIAGLPDDLMGCFCKLMEEPQVVILFLAATYFSHIVGGLAAGWLPNRKCPAPYGHAVVGSIIYSLVNNILMVPLMIWSGQAESPSQQEAGAIILAVAPTFVFAMLGVWLSSGTRRVSPGGGASQAAERQVEVGTESAGAVEPAKSSRKAAAALRKPRASRLKRRKPAAVVAAVEAAPPEAQVSDAGLTRPRLRAVWLSRRRFTIFSICAVAVTLAGVAVWVVSLPEPSECLDPPETATLNYWPVTYVDHREPCHDFPPIDARLVKKEGYSRNREEWERGLTAHAGDEIYAVVYINNGAVTNAEHANPGMGNARNVRLTTEVRPEEGDVHYINVRFAGDNTNSVSGSFKITTAEHERLEVVPRSGEIIDYNLQTVSKGFDVGNNVVNVGDFEPKWETSRFIRFKLRVVG